MFTSLNLYLQNDATVINPFYIGENEVKAVGKPSRFNIITLHPLGKLMPVWEVMETGMLSPRKVGRSAQTLR